MTRRLLSRTVRGLLLLAGVVVIGQLVADLDDLEQRVHWLERPQL
jgi:hypothetical protein